MEDSNIKLSAKLKENGRRGKPKRDEWKYNVIK